MRLLLRPKHLRRLRRFFGVMPGSVGLWAVAFVRSHGVSSLRSGLRMGGALAPGSHARPLGSHSFSLRIG